MKIRTNAGEVELTAEMVVRGMVFRSREVTFVVGRRVDGNVFCNVRDPEDYATVLRWPEFLGCDPKHASRADCERYGIPNHIDAAAHGFARLRDGGAVDLWRELPYAAVFVDAEGRRFTPYNGAMTRNGDRFLGLDTRHARPEDRERLCCGSDGSESGDCAHYGLRCTLAIGPHDEHEHLASKTKWRDAPKPDVHVGVDLARTPDQTAVAVVGVPKPRGCHECSASEGRRCDDDCPRVVRYKATRCGARPVRGQVLSSTHPDTWLCATGEERCDNDAGKCSQHTFSKDSEFFHWAEPATFWNCPICTQQIMPYGEFGVVGFGVYDPKAGRSRSAPVCEDCYKDHGDNVAALRWEGDRLVRKTGAEVVEEARVKMAELTEQFKRFPRCEDCDYITCDDDCPRVRREKEAPLVALVAAVPAGLDPVGWRAAVLAADETHALCSKERVRWDYEYLAEWLPGVIAKGMDECDASTPYADAFHAYQRALAPRSKVAPERKMGGPAIVVDDGRDD